MKTGYALIDGHFSIIRKIGERVVCWYKFGGGGNRCEQIDSFKKRGVIYLTIEEAGPYIEKLRDRSAMLKKFLNSRLTPKE